MSSGYGFLKSHIISQCEYPSNLKDIDVFFENGDVSSGYGFMNSQNYLQHNGLE